MTPVDGIRIAWDNSTLNRIAPLSGRVAGYYGYARMIQLNDGKLACIYECSSGNIELTFSSDNGKSWSSPGIVFPKMTGINMAVPDIIQLNDNSLLAACNPRPTEPYSEERRFGMRVRKSLDGGNTWETNQLIYEADYTFENGCWEPALFQLPDGEVQLYFSNEGIYFNTSEQNISIFRSENNGETWTTEPEIVGFRASKRDGMPTPLLIEETGEILVSVEDNKEGEFKPTVYHESLAKNWSDGYISADDPRRSYEPLTEEFLTGIYAGGPFLERLGTGEVLLSYQTTYNRDLIWNYSSMAVEISDDYGNLFSRRSIPFIIPNEKWGLWNSLAVINDNTPVAISSTNAYSEYSTEVWMIKGKIIPVLTVPEGSPVIDGNPDDNCWPQDYPYFIGQKGDASLKASICADAENISFLISVSDPEILTGNAPAEKDGVILQFDTERKGYFAPHTGIFEFIMSPDGALVAKEGAFGSWNETGTENVLYEITRTDSSYVLELSVPRTFLNLPPDTGHTPGINFILKNSSSTSAAYEESITSNDAKKPYTWSPLTLRADGKKASALL